MKNNIFLLVAIATNNVIGKGPTDVPPWYLPLDLKFFKEKTTGHTIITGKNTFLSIVNKTGKKLPNRDTIVVSSDTSLAEKYDVIVVPTVEEAINHADKTRNICISGGVRIYEEGIKFADTLYVTRVHKKAEGNIFFPAIDWRPFIKNEAETITYPKDDKHECSYTFELYERRN